MLVVMLVMVEPPLQVLLIVPLPLPLALQVRLPEVMVPPVQALKMAA
jgi:hypothetical protein